MADLVPLDWDMPVMNGVDLLRIPGRERVGSVPVVFCRSGTDLVFVRAAPHDGVSEHVMKPCGGETLAGALRQVGLS